MIPTSVELCCRPKVVSFIKWLYLLLSENDSATVKQKRVVIVSSEQHNGALEEKVIGKAK